MEATCLDSDQLHEFALGLGDADRFDTIAQHVEGCDNCQQNLERLDASTNDLVGRLGRLRPAARGDQAADDQWAQAVLDSRITADAGWDLARRLLEGVVRLDRFELRSELGVGTT